MQFRDVTDEILSAGDGGAAPNGFKDVTAEINPDSVPQSPPLYIDGPDPVPFEPEQNVPRRSYGPDDMDPNNPAWNSDNLPGTALGRFVKATGAGVRMAWQKPDFGRLSDEMQADVDRTFGSDRPLWEAPAGKIISGAMNVGAGALDVLDVPWSGVARGGGQAVQEFERAATGDNYYPMVAYDEDSARALKELTDIGSIIMGTNVHAPTRPHLPDEAARPRPTTAAEMLDDGPELAPHLRPEPEQPAGFRDVTNEFMAVADPLPGQETASFRDVTDEVLANELFGSKQQMPAKDEPVAPTEREMAEVDDWMGVEPDDPSDKPVSERLVDLARSVRETPAGQDVRKRWEPIGPVTEAEAAAIRDSAAKAGVDLDVTGYTHTADNFGMRHTLRKHGDDVAERRRGQAGISDEDFGKIPDIIESTTPIYSGRSAIGEHTVTYLKQFGDELIELEYVVADQPGRKNLALKSLRKWPMKRSGASGGYSAGDLPASSLTPEAAPDVTAPNMGLLGDSVNRTEAPVHQPSLLDPAKRVVLEDPLNLPAPRVVTTPKGGKVTFPRPLDLVTWLRTKGGLMDQGGELSHVGVNNRTRGLGTRTDVEKFIGPILSDNGLPLDEAARQAWEAGYFPDHAERPTVDDFVQAVGETFNGTSRRYHPDDLEELAVQDHIDRLYEEAEGLGIATRGKKPAHVYQMVQAHQASLPENGRPLEAADVPHTEAPSTDGVWRASLMDEPGNVQAPNLDAESPVYTEGQLTKLTPDQRAALGFKGAGENPAGNINLANIHGVEDISRALSGIAEQYDGFEPARRGVQSHEATQALADQMGMSFADLTRRTKGQAFNAEQALASRQLLANSADELMRLSRAVAEAKVQGIENERLLFDFQQAYTRHVAIQEQVAGMTAEAGRALNSFRIPAMSDRLRLQGIKAMMDGGKGEAIEDLASKLATLDDPAEMNKLARAAYSPKLSDKLLEVWINGLLSGPETHIVNSISNAAFQLLQVPENLVAAGIGKARGGAEAVRFREVATQVASLLQGVKEGAAAAWKTLRSEEPSDVMSKLDQRRYKALGDNGLAQAVRVPSRLLMTADEFYKGIAYRTELNGLAMRKALSEGRTGKDLAARVEELKVNPTDDMIVDATNHARYVTFTSELGEVGQGVQRVVNAWPALRVVFPFVRTPSNLLKRAAERTPLGFFMKDVREAKGAARDKALARIITGSAIGALVVKAATEGAVTGSGPSDPARQKELQATGWRPYSIKINGRYVPYGRVDPLSTLIGVYADAGEVFGGLADEDKKDVAGLITASVAANVVNKTYFQGLSELANVLSDPDRYGSTYVQNLTGTLVPAIVAQGARTADPVVRDTKVDPNAAGIDRQLSTIVNAFKARIPGASSDLPARRDPWGDPVTRDPKVAADGLEMLSPFRASPVVTDPVRLEVNRLQMGITPPDRTLDGQKLAPAEYERFSVIAGEAAHKRLQKLMADARWEKTPDGMRRRLIDHVMSNTREIAKLRLYQERPDLFRRGIQGKVDKVQSLSQ